MARAVAAALAAVVVRSEDAGAVALARRYAALIDAATPASRYRPLLRAVRAGLDPADEAAHDAVVRIEDALGAHSVASDLGPKLLAVLGALGMTVAGRRGVGGGGSGGSAVGDRVDEFTARRARKHAP